MSSGSAPLVLVAEPTPLFADVIAGALHTSGYDARQIGDASADLLAEARRLGAAVLVVGPSLGRSGLAAIVPGLLAANVRTVIVSPNGLDRVEASIMLAGASGYLSAASDDIADVAAEVGRVVNGSSPLHPDVVRAMLRHWRDSQASAGTAASEVQLTAREMDVVRGLREGLTTRLLAARLGVSEKTVENHKSRLFAKVGAKNASQALQLVTAQRLA